MDGLLMHAGGKYAAREELGLIQLPEATNTYQPVPHDYLADTILKMANDILTGFTFHKDRYGLAREGAQMFGFMSFKHTRDDIGLSIGFRNSYDRSMSVGIGIGASVFVCDNQTFLGEMVIMRKHTINVWKYLEDTIVSSLYKSGKNYERVVEDYDRMKTVEMNDDKAYKAIGLLYGRGVLTPRQLPVVKNEWLNPSYEDFKPRTLNSFYNACTHALKDCPPLNAIDRHIELHNCIARGDNL